VLAGFDGEWPDFVSALKPRTVRSPTVSATNRHGSFWHQQGGGPKRAWPSPPVNVISPRAPAFPCRGIVQSAAGKKLPIFGNFFPLSFRGTFPFVGWYCPNSEPSVLI
jgi:hypothetical protein